ncbi:hypothetical protein [Candidatus Tremblaya phenacola]|uniref:hypothetical protein n=1 Tax=Candidatus Tremblayella phenacoccinincola TaxID=1010676 RepID=UPI00133094AE|nr:hypothetical protein [Candidatus Tremblaya phenacola]
MKKQPHIFILFNDAVRLVKPPILSLYRFIEVKGVEYILDKDTFILFLLYRKHNI